MNEIIIRLAEQAGSTHKQNLGVYQFYSGELEKFTELIVKECVSYIGDKGMLAGGGCTIVGEELLHVSEGLEKYFGVKE